MSAIAIPSFPGHLGGHIPTAIDRPVAVADKPITGPTLADSLGQARMHGLMSARANAARRQRLAGTASSAAPIRLMRTV